MADWLHKLSTIAISYIVMTASFSPTSAVTCNVINESCRSSSTIKGDLIENIVSDDFYLEYLAESEELVEDIVSGIYSCGTKALQTLGTFLKSGKRVMKSGLRTVRKHPLKALTVFLALQSKNSPFTVPGAEAITVSNSDQVLSYVLDGPAVPILPMTINNSSSPSFNVKLSLPDLASATVTSMANVLSFTRQTGTSSGNWNTNGNKASMNTFLGSLSLQPARGYKNSISLNILVCEGSCPPGLYVFFSITFLPPYSEFSVTNLNQTLPYLINGPAITLLPMKINSPSSQFSAQLTLLDKLSGTIGDTQLGALGRSSKVGVTGDRSSVEASLARISLIPALGYTTPIYVTTSINSTALPTGNATGLIIFNPVNATTMVVPQSPSKVGSTSSSTSRTTQLSTSSGTISNLMSSTSSFTQETTSTESSTIPITMATVTSSSQAQASSSPSQHVGDSSSTSPFSTTSRFDSTTTYQGISNNQSSSPLNSVSKQSVTYAIIGGAVGGVVICGSILAGVVAYMRKKYSSAHAEDHVLPIQQPLPDADSAIESPQVSANYELLPIQSPINSSYNAFPYAPIIFQNDVIQPQAPAKSEYRNLPTKKHYETSLPQNIKNYEELFSSLHKAAEDGDSFLIETILGFDVPVDSVDGDGYTALHLAARAGHVDACNLLLDRGANKQLMTKDDKTALLLAKAMGHNQVVAILGQ